MNDINTVVISEAPEIVRSLRWDAANCTRVVARNIQEDCTYAADMIEQLEAKYKEAQSLLDGCYEVVELWNCQAPSQIVWKRAWLEKARLHGASGV